MIGVLRTRARAELVDEAGRDLEGAAVLGDVLAEEQHVRVAPHRLAEAVGDRVDIALLAHGAWRRRFRAADTTRG